MVEKSYSAGGVIVGPKGLVVVVSQPGKVWSLPKGRLEHGEDDKAAALREIKEETGLTDLKFVKKLGTYKRYKIAKNGKDQDVSVTKYITIFLYTTSEERLEPIDPDNEQALWVEPDKVVNRLSASGDIEFYNGILPEVKEFIKNRA